MRTEQIYLKENKVISELCHLSKNLYNQTNYVLRQQFTAGEKLSKHSELIKMFQTPSGIEEHNNYQKLPAQTAQWTIKNVTKAWHSFFMARREFTKHPERFKKRPNPPKYKNRKMNSYGVF